MKLYQPVYQNKIYMGVLIISVGVIISLFIVPDFLKIRTLDSEIDNLIQMQEVQQKLRPLYNQVSMKTEYEKLLSLSVPPKGWFKRSRVGNISQIFKDLAEKNGLECLISNPDVDTLFGDSQAMLTNVVLKGKFERFRNFLFDLTKLDYLDSLEEIQVISGQTGKKYMLKIWISIQ